MFFHRVAWILLLGRRLCLTLLQTIIEIIFAVKLVAVAVRYDMGDGRKENNSHCWRAPPWGVWSDVKDTRWRQPSAPVPAVLHSVCRTYSTYVETCVRVDTVVQYPVVVLRFVVSCLLSAHTVQLSVAAQHLELRSSLPTYRVQRRNPRRQGNGQLTACPACSPGSRQQETTNDQRPTGQQPGNHSRSAVRWNGYNN